MQTLTVSALPGFIDRLSDRPPLLLDVREDWERSLAQLQVPGVETRALPMGQVPARLAELDPTQAIIVFCHHGMRSAQVVAFLMRHGHADVYNLTGGIDAWSIQMAPQVPRYG